MKTELRQLVGKRLVKTGVETIEHPIDQVLYDGRQIGLLGHEAGANLTFFSSADPATFDEIKRDVVELRDGRPIDRMIARAQPLPEELLTTEEEEEEDEQE